jgi:hypothetical protein
MYEPVVKVFLLITFYFKKCPNYNVWDSSFIPTEFWPDILACLALKISGIIRPFPD